MTRHGRTIRGFGQPPIPPAGGPPWPYAMPPYAPQIPAEDRWAIVAYIRALQLSQNGTINDLPPAHRAKLEQSGGAAR